MEEVYEAETTSRGRDSHHQTVSCGVTPSGEPRSVGDLNLPELGETAGR